MPFDDLLNYLFEGRPHLLIEPMARWLADSRRFVTFVATYQNKIRKKIRTTPDRESVLGLRLELETAYRLLQERALSVVYEPELAKRIRSPDFAVTYTTSLTFMLEVTRVQADSQSTVALQLANAIPAKLGQLLPQHSNVLLVGVETQDLAADDLRNAMLGLQQRAERNDAALLQRNGFRDRADFFGHFQRLSEVLVRGADVEEASSIVTWVNPQAKQALPGKVRAALYRSQTS